LDFVFGVGGEAYDAASVFVVARVVDEAEGLVPVFGFLGAISHGAFVGVVGGVIEAQAFESWDGGGLGLEVWGDE
jgi:hypothetical protein